MSKYFVYINGLKGPEPQLWADMITKGDGKSREEPLFIKTLSKDEERLTLNELTAIYKLEPPNDNST